jgi:YidC/Oxa1 family membrane protein insertase
VGEIGYFFNIIFTFPIYNVLMLLYHLFGDFGLSIIVLTLCIRLCLVPLTLKQLRSTKAMQAIQPLLADVKKQYPNDPRGQMDAQQAIYKEYGISPVAGCLPLLLQLPVLYGMYGAMKTVLTSGVPTLTKVNANIYPFLPKFTSIHQLNFNLNWFTFLNSAWHISLATPDPTHILPVLAGLATFAQLRMSQARTNANRTPGQTKDMMSQQMQIMSFIMPFFTLFIAWNFPAGLALYWTTTSVFSMVQQYFVTGWGSLFTAPALAGANKSDSTPSGGTGRGKTSTSKVVDSTAEMVSENASVATSSNGYAGGSSSSTARRRRPNSASARRRGSATTPRRNPSRSQSQGQG